MKLNNNQKLREVLEKIDSELKSYCSENETLDDRFYNDPPDYTCIRDSLLDINRLVKAALAAPARNCDIYTIEDEAYREYKKEMEYAPEKEYLDYEDWLFADAKGECK